SLTNTEIDPDEVSARVGVAPTFVLREGRASPLNWRALPSHATAWVVRTRYTDRGAVQSLRELVTMLEPGERELAGYGRLHRAAITLVIATRPGEVPGVVVPRDLISKFHKLNAQF